MAVWRPGLAGMTGYGKAGFGPLASPFVILRRAQRDRGTQRRRDGGETQAVAAEAEAATALPTGSRSRAPLGPPVAGRERRGGGCR